MRGTGLATPDAELLEVLASTADSADHAGQPAAEALETLRGSAILGTVIPEEYGGLGGDAVESNRCVTRVARHNASIAIILFQHFAVSSRIVEWGSPQQKETTLPRLATGQWLAASAWSESGAGAHKRNLAARATRQSDGSWLLDGTKSFATGAGIADVYLVLAQDDQAEPSRNAESAYGGAGQTFFLIEAGNPGIVPDLSLDLIGMRGSATGFLQLRECAVPTNAVLGPVGETSEIIAGVRESGATLGAVSVGIAQAAYDIGHQHAVKRGLLEHQAFRHRLVDLNTRIEAAVGLVEYAGRRESTHAGMTTLHSKVFASETSEQVIREIATLLGSSGFVRDHQINRLAHDARAVALMGPTNDLCRELVSMPWTN
jgi:alkylation response protein AidB-like acyl-CoA dehydrogenase